MVAIAVVVVVDPAIAVVVVADSEEVFAGPDHSFAEAVLPTS